MAQQDFLMSEDRNISPVSERTGDPHTDVVLRVTWVGLVINTVLFAFKLFAGIIGRSQVVVADAIHSLSDSSTDVAIVIGVRYWSQPPDENHPHGHRRIETVITAFISLALGAVGVGLIYNGLMTLHEHHEEPPGWIAFIAAVISIITKEILYHWTISVGRRIRSQAMIANAWHHRSDAFSSVPAALAVAGAAIHPSWSFLDHVGAVVVSLFILQAAWKLGWPALQQLIDLGASQVDCEQIRAIALATENVIAVHAIRTRHIGSGLQVDLHVLVDGAMTVRQGHNISREVKRRLLEMGPDIADVVVHLEPYEESQKDRR